MPSTSLQTQLGQDFAERLEAFARSYARETGDETLQELSERMREGATQADRDALSTRLMEAYKQTASKEAFALLYELNQEDFLRLIYHHLRRSWYPVDAADVLQEVFFNVYRYPFKFKPDRNTAFRNWTHSIIRNTVLKHSRRAQRDRAVSLGGGVERDGLESVVPEPVDEKGPSPYESAAAREAAESLVRAWLLYLQVYLDAYRCLTPREKRVLYLVEVEGLPYREAAQEVKVKVENLKMMVFRARRKIHTIMKRRFQVVQDAADRLVLDHGAGQQTGGVN